MGIETAITDSEIKDLKEKYKIAREPLYIPQGNELEIIRKAKDRGHGVALLGPTGAGKSRLAKRIAFDYKQPYAEIIGDEKFNASKAIGSKLVVGGETKFVPGPVYRALKMGAVLHFAELLRANPDCQSALFPLTETSARYLVIPDTGEVLPAPKEFFFTYSTNPGKAYKIAGNPTFPAPNFAQRCDIIYIGYARGEHGAEVIRKEAEVDEKVAKQLNKLAEEIDSLYEAQENKGKMPESVGYHALIKAAHLIKDGLKPYDACRVAITNTLSPDPSIMEAVDGLVRVIIKN